jgi:hypothetical protein
VTQKLKVDTAVCLLTEQHPIKLEDQDDARSLVAGVLLGIGDGWNVKRLPG